MYDWNWYALGEELVRVGLIFGAVFQVICIGAAIFLPFNSDSKDNDVAGERLNEKFLLSEESEDEAPGEARSAMGHSSANRNVHQATHLHRIHQRNSGSVQEERNRSSSSSNSSRLTSRRDKKKRRWNSTMHLHD